MFGVRKVARTPSKPTIVDFDEIIQTSSSNEIAQRLYEMADTSSAHHKPSGEMYKFARRYGGSLKKIDEVEQFQKLLSAVHLNQTENNRIYRLNYVFNEVVRGFVNAGGIKTLDDAIRASGLLIANEPRWDIRLEDVEGELIKATLPLLTEAAPSLTFILTLKTYRSLVICSILHNKSHATMFEHMFEARQQDIAREEEVAAQACI